MCVCVHHFLKQSFPCFNVLFDLVQFHFIPFNLQTHTAAHGQRHMVSMKKDDAIEENDNYHLTFTNLSTERERRRERENGQMRDGGERGERVCVCHFCYPFLSFSLYCSLLLLYCGALLWHNIFFTPSSAQI